MNELKTENNNSSHIVKKPIIIDMFMQLIIAGLPVIVFLVIIANKKVLPIFLFNRWFYLTSYLIIYIWYFWWLIKAVKQANSFRGWIKELTVLLLISLSLSVLMGFTIFTEFWIFSFSKF